MRRIAGIITTVVMVLSLAEIAWAATCPPADGTASVVVLSEDGLPQCDGCRHAPRGEHGDEERPCPFGPVASSQGCLITTSLPASATVHLGTPAEADASIPGLDTEPELLLATPHFRPPKS